jgi:hypothetical protein
MASPTVDKTSGKPRRKRRWLQFGLPTLLGLVTQTAVLCVVGPWATDEYRAYRLDEAYRLYHLSGNHGGTARQRSFYFPPGTFRTRTPVPNP